MNALKLLNRGGRQSGARRQSGRQPVQPQPVQPQPVQPPAIDIMDVESVPSEETVTRRPTGPRREIKLLDIDGNVIEQPSVQNRQRHKFKSSSKETRYYSSVIPWMSRKNDGIFILSVGSTDISPYIVQEVQGINRTVVHNGQTFFRVNEKFRQLMVDYRFERKQIGNVLYINTTTGTLTFKIGYLIKSTLIVQNEEMFSKEMKFFNDGLETQYSRILKIKKEAIREDVKTAGISVLSKALHDIAPNVLSYGIYDIVVKRDTSYIIRVIDILSSKSSNVEEFLEYLGNIVIFITSVKFSKVFIERLKEEYYLPEILANLPLSEKLPEIYDPNTNRTVKEKKKMNDIIERSLKIFIQRVLTLIYVRRNPSERIERDTLNYGITNGISKMINKLTDWKSECVNVDNIPDNEIILYKDETNKVYCLSIPEILKSIGNGDITNKHTNKKFSNEFIQHIKTYYNIKEVDEKSEEDVNELVEDIDNLNIDSELDIEDLFADILNFDDTQEASEEPVQEESEITQEDGDTEMVDVSEESNIENNTNEKKCKVCNKMYNATGMYKTIDSNSELVEYYCSMECFNK